MVTIGHSSEGEIVSEIQSLKSAIDPIGQSVSLWNRLMIWSFSLAAFFTVCDVAVTKIVVLRTEEQSITQDLLNAAEERQLKSALRDKDLRIADEQNATTDLSGKLELEKQKTARFQKEADAARLALAKEPERVSSLQQWRRVDREHLVEALKGRPKPKEVVIWYRPGDNEANLFAGDIEVSLGTRGAGWNVAEPKPIPDTRGDTRVPEDAPIELRLGAWHGFAILTKAFSSPAEVLETKTPISAL